MQPAQEPLLELVPQKIFFLLLPLVCFSQLMPQAQLLPFQKLVLALEIHQAVPAADVGASWFVAEEEVSC